MPVPAALQTAPLTAHHVVAATVSLLGDPALHIDVNGGGGNLPGTDTLSQLASGIGFWALIAAVVGIFLGALMWAFGSYSQNYQQAYNGRRGVLISALAALLIGAGPHIISVFFGQGGRVV